MLALVIIIINLLFSFIMYYVSPLEYNFAYCTVGFISFCIVFFTYMLMRKDKNYFSFEIIFTITFFCVYFLYPVFAKPLDAYHFVFPFTDIYITKCLFLSLIAYNCFVLGNISTLYKKSKKFITFKRNNKEYSTTYNFSIILMFTILIITIAKFYYFGINRYTSNDLDVGIWSYISVLKRAIIMASITVMIYNLCKKRNLTFWFKKTLPFWVILFLDILINFIQGYRGEPLAYLLTILAGWYIYKDKLSLLKFTVLLFIGLVSLSYFAYMREGAKGLYDFNIFNLTNDLMTNYYTVYKGFDYVYNYGTVLLPFLFPLTTCIPLFSGTIANIFNVSAQYTSSAMFFTYQTLGNYNVGMGTNIVMSIYLSLGIVGVVVCMYFLGKFINYISNDIEHGSIYQLFFYLEFMSISVYLVRAEFFYAASQIVWGLIFLKIITKIKILKN